MSDLKEPSRDDLRRYSEAIAAASDPFKMRSLIKVLVDAVPSLLDEIGALEADITRTTFELMHSNRTCGYLKERIEALEAALDGVLAVCQWRDPSGKEIPEVTTARAVREGKS